MSLSYLQIYFVLCCSCHLDQPIMAIVAYYYISIRKLEDLLNQTLSYPTFRRACNRALASLQILVVRDI